MKDVGSSTIYHIAERSGYSIATVSRVLNGSDKVSDKARQRVLEVMKEEHYTPNAFARGLGLNTMKMVGILCTDVADMYYAKSVSLLQKNLNRQGLEMLLSSTGNELKRKKKAMQMLLEKRVDAVILVGSALQEMDSNAHIQDVAQRVPVIIINGYIDLPEIVCVYCDEQQAMRDIVLDMATQSCKKILYIYDALTFSGLQKKNGYLKGLRAAGLEEDERHTVFLDGGGVAEARARVAELLESGLQFDAVLASEDKLAVGAQKALLERGIQVPIVGFNNSLLAECATPALSSVDNMLESLCSMAVRFLKDALNGEAVPRKTVVSAELVERETFRRSAQSTQIPQREI